MKLKISLKLCRNRISVTLFMLINVFASINLYAQKHSYKKESLFPYSFIYKTEKKITVQNLDSLIDVNAINLVESKATHPTSNDFLWIKFQLNWKKGETDKVIELDNPHINNVVLYEKNGDCTYKKIGFGGDKSYKFHERSYINRRYIFPIKNTLEEIDYYLMIDNRKSLMVIPLWIWDINEFEVSEKKQSIFYVIYFSFIFFIGLISLIIGLTNRKKIFFLYGLYVLSLWIYMFTTLGFSFQYLYPTNLKITNDTRYLSVTMLIIASISFMVSFLKMKIHTKKTFKLLRAIQYIFLIIIILYLYDPNIFYKRHIALTYFFRFIYILIISCVIRGVFKIRKQEKNRVRLFILSFSFVIIGLLLYIGLQLGIIPHSWFYINPVVIGVGIEVLVLTIAMFYVLKKIVVKNTLLINENDGLLTEVSELNDALSKKKEKFVIETITLKSKAIINTANILYVKSDGHYVEYYLENKTKPEIDRNSLTSALKKLPENSFVRIHKSYLVNIHRIKIINSTKVMLNNGVWINLSRIYKQQLKDILHKDD